VIQVTPQTRILVAVEPPDFRCGIDGLAKVCRAQLGADPFTGAVFVFRNRRSTSVKLLAYDGQGFWLLQKRLSSGKFRFWPSSDAASATLKAHELHVLLFGGDPTGTRAAAEWRPLSA
jgi:transposase